jgi:FMN phosphatase YigB (HAD superfamily)
MTIPKLFLFDLWGTLWDGDCDARLGSEALLAYARNPRQHSLESIARLAAELHDELDRAKEGSMLETTVIGYQKLLYDLLEIEVLIPPREAELLFWKAGIDTRLTEGIRPLLELLASMGIDCSVVSNTTFSGAVIEQELEKHGLRRFFRHVICSSDYGVKKPFERIFQVALVKHGCPAGQACFIGDTIELDMNGAAGAGLRPLWYNRDRKPMPAGRDFQQIASWAELEETIRAGGLLGVG